MSEQMKSNIHNPVGLNALGEFIDRMIEDIRSLPQDTCVHKLEVDGDPIPEKRVKYAVHQWHVRGTQEEAEDEELIAYLDTHIHYSYEMVRFNMSMITAEATRYDCYPYAFVVKGDRAFSYILEGPEYQIQQFLSKWYYTPPLGTTLAAGLTVYEAKPLRTIRKEKGRN